MRSSRAERLGTLLGVTEPLTVPERSSVDQDDELVHQVCCRDNDVALCGRDVSLAEWRTTPAHERDCVVCDDLNRGRVCPLFGECVPNVIP